jgi:ankyrin repeat protein
VQQVLEAAVMALPPGRAAGVLNHSNRKGQTALMLACANGCVPARPRASARVWGTLLA